MSVRESIRALDSVSPPLREKGFQGIKLLIGAQARAIVNDRDFRQTITAFLGAHGRKPAENRRKLEMAHDLLKALVENGQGEAAAGIPGAEAYVRDYMRLTAPGPVGEAPRPKEENKFRPPVAAPGQ